MTHKKKTTKLAAILVGATMVWGCNNPAPKESVVTTAPGGLPQDVKVNCPLTDTTFNSWFVSGKPAENGIVSPANSVTFPHVNNCSFYQWSEQMFLWLASPAPARYGGGNTVLESPVFYDVSPEVNGKRTITQHKPGTIIHVQGHITQNGPNRLPVIKDKLGRLFEVEMDDARGGAKPMVKNATGNTVEIDRIETAANGLHTFMAKDGKAIEKPMAVIKHPLNKSHIVHRFSTTAGKPVFLAADGSEIQTEEGQATGDVLMAKNGSLVYYILMVNDVYAQFVTAVNNKRMSGVKFPTTAADLDTICMAARQNGVTLPDSQALAIELKTSWIEAKDLPDPDSYITIDAMIPTYKTTDSTWIPNGERKAKLALVGMHIVGSLAGHPEMAWATFEHRHNTPNAAYQYVDVNGNVKTVPRDTGSNWLFSSNASDKAPNVSHMQAHGDTLVRDSIGMTASNTLRSMPWGSAFDSVTNPEDKSSAASNSEVISIHNAVNRMLPGKDIRKNYLFIGATWTNMGIAPNGNSYSLSDTVNGVAIGTSVLANSTMETYIQTPGTSCFTCHNNGNSLSPDSLSHVFGAIQKALPSVPKSMGK